MSVMTVLDVAFRNIGVSESWNSQKMRDSRKFKSTLVVPWDVPAFAAARIADFNEIRFIMIRGSQGELAGLILPAWTRSQIGRLLGNRHFTTLAEAFAAYEAYPLARTRKFHSELLNKDRPVMYWCSAGHSVDGCPCSIDGHQNLGCNADTV